MSFTDEYLKALEEEKKKKKKNTSQNTQVKKTQSTSTKNTSTTSKRDDYTSEFLSALDDDIAPVKKTTESEKKYSGIGGKFGVNSKPTIVSISEDGIPRYASKEKKRTWFDKGVLDDGFQWSDIPKGILGTGTDATTHIGAGLLGIGEKVTDAVAMLGNATYQTTYMQQAMQDEIIYNAMTGKQTEGIVDRYLEEKERSDEATAEFVAKDLYNEEEIAKKIISAPMKKWTGIDSEKDSFFGDKTDALAQSGGQLLGQVAVSAIPGVGQSLAMGMMGATALGSEAESAFKQGATYDEALFSGLVSATAEVVTEKIGGISFGGKTLTDKAVDLFSRKATTKLTRALVTSGKLTADGLAEGGEELLSGYMSALGQKLSYMEDKEIEELFNDDDKLESFIGGLVLGGTFSGVSTLASDTNVSGMTKDEQSVVDKVYNDAVAEEEKGGKKLTSKEKTKIYDNVVESVEKGRLDIEVIEEALGGESYDAYKKASDENTALKNERDELNEIKASELTGKQSDRLAELKGMNLDDTTNLDELGKKWKDDVYNRLSSDRKGQGSLLLESYRERARRGQAFTADLSQYEGKKREAVERAIKSGVLNNTNRSHELVDILSNIEADKGIIFDYTDNKKLKESGFAIGGKTINGYVKDGSITLNMQSSKAWESTVGHEITHVLEGTKVYSELQTSLFEYAKSKGEFDTRKADIMKLYEKVENADIDGELTAELVSDYLFNDKNFINHLTGNRTVFQKVWDEVKYLYKVATGKEKASIEKVMKEFDRAWKEMGKANVKSEGTKYSVSDKNIKDESTGYGYGETYFTMSYNQDGKTVATLEYGEYEGTPNVKMVKVDPEYRRQGIATKLLQELQKKYPDTEIDFGMTTPDGTKLLESITYDVTDDTVVAKQNEYKALQAELDELQGKLDVLYDTENLTEAQEEELEKLGDRWTEVYDAIRKLEPELRGKNATKTFVKYSISGVNSKTADSSLLLKAEHMLDTGVDSETVRQETGWYEGYDGKMRYEIDDSKSELIEKPNLEKHEDEDNGTYFTGKLSDVLDHSDLYKAYPQLKDVNIIIQPTEKGISGVYQRKTNYITLDINLFKRHTKEYENYLNGGRKAEIERIEQTPEYQEYSKWYDDESLHESMEPEKWLEEEEKARNKFFSSELGKRYYQLNWGKPPMNTTEFGWGKEAKSVLMHEIQHAIQEIEDFARGSSVKYWKQFGTPIKTKMQQAEHDEISQELRKVFNENPAFYIDMQELISSAPTVPRGEIDWNTLEQIEDDPVEWQEWDKKRDLLEEKYGDEEVTRFFSLHYKYEQSSKAGLSADDAYFHTAGEIEARDTENRLNLDAEGRKNKRPDIDNKNVVFADAKYSLSESIDNQNPTDNPDIRYSISEKPLDNSQNLTYNGMRGEAYVRTEEFRNLQAECQRMSDEDIQLYHSGNKQIDDGIRERFSRSIKSVFLESKNNGVSYDKGILSLTAKDNKFDIHEGVNGSLFHDVFEMARNHLKYGELVDLHDVETTDDGIGYNDCYNYLSDDGLSGFSITPDGDLISVFNASGKSGFLRAISPIVKEKAETLDCYASENQNLMEIYTAIFGFKTASVMDYNMEYDHDNIAENHGMPKIAFMVNTESAVETKQFTKDEYDEAVTYRNGFILSNDIAPVKNSLSNNGEQPSTKGTPLRELYLEQDIAPIREDVAENATTTEAQMPYNDYAPATAEEVEALNKESFAAITDEDVPPEAEQEIDYMPDSISIDTKSLKQLSKAIGEKLPLTDKFAKADLEKVIQDFSKGTISTREELYTEVKKRFDTYYYKERSEGLEQVKQSIKTIPIYVSDDVKMDFGKGKDGYQYFMQKHFGKMRFSKEGMSVDKLYDALVEVHPEYFSAEIWNVADRLRRIAEVVDMPTTNYVPQPVDERTLQDATDFIYDSVQEYKETVRLTNSLERENAPVDESLAPPVDEATEDIAPLPDAISPMTEAEANTLQDAKAQSDATAEGIPKGRKQLHHNIISDMKAVFSRSGYDFDDVLSNARNLSTFSTVDNIPQRVMEKALGYKEGKILSDLTVNKVAQNETEGIKWLNSFTDRKNGLLAQISKQYGIKPASKESAAAQMYAEGFYVAKNNDIIAYGDAELEKDFPNEKVRNNIKGLAKDPRIRQIYDETLTAINASRKRNGYPEIGRLDNYFLHFRAMEDTFSKLGLPYNPNDIRAEDLPTDLNGVTADLKPGQPYFASAMHREGKRTTFDLLGGLERYLTSAKNQIYHIDDIQTLRALRNYIADSYGQAHGLESIDMLPEEEAQEKIEQVYGKHLSTFAKFLNEEANVLAGKKTLIDRGLEGAFGRRSFVFMDTVNKQVGSNMVGYNISSSLTNFVPVAQTLAKTNKFDFLKAFTQTVSNKFSSIYGQGDNFAENSPVIIRRKGADRFYRTPYQKVADAGYVFMSAVDDISTEIIARTKYNELTRKGMSEQQAHFETDKWVSRLMGDRSLGQMPQLYNSKMLGVFTKFQLEVRNQLDSQFYDTIQEAKVSNEEIENALLRNAKTAAKVTSTLVQLAIAQHLFGKAFEAVAGYNPAFDIISTLSTLFGFDDDEESEDTVLDNVEQGFFELLEDLPYTSTFTGGRIPISSALPIEQLVKGKDDYGNDKSRWETALETLPYHVLPGGYGQIKKTYQGLKMFNTDEEHPVMGSYTDSGKLRFPVEDTPLNRIQAGLFGQYANENAREYFDNGYDALNKKQIQEYQDVDLPIGDYWKYREGVKGLKTNGEKADFINSLDIADWQKNILMNNILDRKEDVDMTNYDDYADFEEFDYAQKNPEKYDFFKANGISYSDYANADEDGKDAYNWAYNNPEKFVLSKAVTDDVITYRSYTDALFDIKADKDASGKTISGSAKAKKRNYIFNLDGLDYGQKAILYRSLYDSADDKAEFDEDIVYYINSRNDLTDEEKVTIYTELGFTVKDGYVYW